MSAAAALDARLADVGLTRRQLAKRARLRSQSYLLRLWRRGGAPLVTAQLLAKALCVSPDVFLWGYSHAEGCRNAPQGEAAKPLNRLHLVRTANRAREARPH